MSVTPSCQGEGMENARLPRVPQQLSLLASHDELPLAFRLDERTRRRGLAHIAQIRAQMAARGIRTSDRSQQHRSAA